MGGPKTTVVDTTPKQTQDLRNAVQGYIMDPKKGGIAGQGTAVAPTLPGPVQVGSSAPVGTSFNSGSDPTRARDVSAPSSYTPQNVSAGQVSTQGTDSVDKLGGANSAFFSNMMAQLQPAFTQQRNEGMAGAKEMAGTLTGSSFANSLGKAVNRSLGSEQATLANYATQGMQMEMGRQQSDASRFLQAAGMNQSANLQAGIANQGAGLSAANMNMQGSLAAQTANQAADTNFMNAMLTRNQQGLAAQQMGSNAEQFNSSQTASKNALQAQLDAQRGAMGYQGQLGVNQQNANNFMQLLGQQATVGAGPTTVQQKSGFGSVLGGIGGMAIGSMLGPIGTAAGGAIGKKIFGG